MQPPVDDLLVVADGLERVLDAQVGDRGQRAQADNQLAKCVARIAGSAPRATARSAATIIPSATASP